MYEQLTNNLIHDVLRIHIIAYKLLEGTFTPLIHYKKLKEIRKVKFKD